MVMPTRAANMPAPTNGRKPPELVGQEACLHQLRSQMKAVSRRDCTVLIDGESGSGKELVARHIHAASPRATSPFVAVDCSTLRDTLFESQLFGHAKGAFTGAEHSTIGLFRAADGGALLLDEVGELRPDVQAKLLRCIQDGAVVPLGAVELIPVNVRIIAATHRNLKEMVHLGAFREDLYYRLNVVHLHVPPLRERPGDILPLAVHFLQQQAEMYQELTKLLSSDAKAALEAYSWPGNIRELRNVIEHAFVFSKGDLLTAADLPEVVRNATTNHRSNGKRNGHGRIVPLEVAERCLITRALRATNGNQTRAAELLGVERHRLSRMVRRHGLRALARARGFQSAPVTY